MTFEDFARLHGLMLDHVIEGRWVRVPTEDHPRKKNGAYIFDGRSGLIQNHAVHESPIRYVSSEPFVPDPQAAAKRQEDERLRLSAEREEHQRAAAAHPVRTRPL